MGKGKNRTNQGGQTAPNTENSSSNEPKKTEETETTKNEENKGGNSNKLNPKGVIILGVFIHCEGCAYSIHKCLRGFDGVEVIEIDSKNHKVTVKGAKANPIKVVERVRKKCGKHVELISPTLPKDKKEEKKEEKKKEVKFVEVTLKVNLHCEGCVKEMKHVIYKMQGVQTVEADMKNSIVKVTGTFEAEKMVEFIKKKAGKHASIVKQDKKKMDDNQSEGGGGGGDQQKGGKKDSIYPNFHPDLVYAPQLFSDENPNGCFIM